MYANTQDVYESGAKYFRWLSALPPAGILTFALLVLMVKLILVEMEEPNEVPAPRIDFPVYEETLIPTYTKAQMPKREEIAHPPEIPDSPPQEIDPAVVSIPKMGGPVKFQEFTEVSFNGMPIPQFLAAAKYPTRAAQNGIEGFVDVRFDISRAGTTENISVVSSSPQGVFERAALEAVKRWRYQPKMVDGEAVIYQDMTQRIRFVMDGSRDA